MYAIDDRIRISPMGEMEIVDPTFDDLPLLRAIDPKFKIQRSPLPGFKRPRLLRTRKMGCGFALAELEQASEEQLWDWHQTGMMRFYSRARSVAKRNEASLLDLKIELARRLMQSCRLCARKCRVNRLNGERGFCGLGEEALLADASPHIAEEPPINPSFLLTLAGCALRCRYCQKWMLLDPEKVKTQPLEPSFWSQLDFRRCRSLSFIGGNPDESFYGILRFLSYAPENWHLPIVWNCHAYSSPETLDLLNGVVDVYLPDLKYGREACAVHLSSAPDYQEVALRSVTQMIKQGEAVICRILVLPGHNACCHFRVLDQLCYLNSPGLTLSVKGQYIPYDKTRLADDRICRRPHPAEVTAVRNYLKSIGLSEFPAIN